VFLKNAAGFVIGTALLVTEAAGSPGAGSWEPGADWIEAFMVRAGERERPSRWAEPFLFLTLYYQNTKCSTKNRPNIFEGIVVEVVWNQR
jgi:hypothetical protein